MDRRTQDGEGRGILRRFHQGEDAVTDIVDYVSAVIGDDEAVIRVGYDEEYEKTHDSGYYLDVVRRAGDAD